MPKRRPPIDPPPAEDPEQLRPEVLASYPELARVQQQLRQQFVRRKQALFDPNQVEIPAEVQEAYRRHRLQQYQRAEVGPRLSLPQWRNLEIRRDRPLLMKVYQRYLRREMAAGRIDQQREAPTDLIDRANGRPAVIEAQIVAIRAENAALTLAIQRLVGACLNETSPPRSASSPARQAPTVARRRRPLKRIRTVKDLRGLLPGHFPADFPDLSANLPPSLKDADGEELRRKLGVAGKPVMSRTSMHRLQTNDVEQWWLKPEGST